MRTLPTEIQIALEKYNNDQGFFRHLFGDHPAVDAIRKLPNTDKHNPFKLYRCFNKNNKPSIYQASFQVYQAVLIYFLEYLDLISDKKVMVYPKNLEYLDLAFLSAKQKTISKNNLVVGLLHWDTFNKQTLMLEERHELIKFAVESLEKQAKGEQHLLVAPEYFYSRPLADSFENHIKGVSHERIFIEYLDKKYHSFYKDNKRYFPGSIRQLEETQYKEINFFLKTLSSEHPNLILFPGTIAYRETIKKETYPSLTLKKRIEDNIQYISFRDKVGQISSINNGNISFYLGKNRKDQDKIKFLKKFKYIAKNTSLCFYQGQQVFAQNKLYNFGEIMEGYPKKLNQIIFPAEYFPETIFLPGVYRGEVGEINDLRFAVDICADHPYGFLKKSLEKKEDRLPLALHICQSAFVNGKLKSQNQSIGGYFIHASSKLEYNTVIKREGEFFYKKESPYLEEKISVLHTEKNKQLNENKYEKGQATLSFFKLPRIVPTFEKTIKDFPKRRMSI